MNRKYIQLPIELFGNLVKFHLLEMEDEETRACIVRGLNEKMDRIQDHDLYTTYKISGSEEERKAAREEYLDRKGVPESFRY